MMTPEVRSVLADAQAHGMDWMACDAETADELSLRYDVRGIPNLVVIQVADDGSTSRLLSRDGRGDIERDLRGGSKKKGGGAGWIARLDV